MVKHEIKLAWKEFSVSLEAMETWLKANAGEHYCGNSAGNELTLHFTEVPSTEIIFAIQDKWDSLEESSAEALAYKTVSEIADAREAKKASGIAKLIALGLTEDEAKALVG